MELVKQSFLYKGVMKIYTILNVWIKNSYIYKLIIGFVNIIENSIKKSFVFNKFTKEIDKEKQMDESIFVKLIYKLVSIYKKIFSFLKIDKLFKDSIFAKTYIWVGFTIALAPFLPTMIMLAMVLACILSFALKIGITENFKLKYTPVNFSVMLFFIVYMFSAITSINVMSSIKIALLVGSFILFYFVIVNSFENEKQVKTVVTIFIIAGVLVSIYGIYQYIFIANSTSSWVDSEMFEDLNTRVYSTFENPNVLGEYLLLVIPVAVSMFFAEKGIFKKAIAFIFVSIMMLCLALTFSRGCYLGILFAASVFVILLNFKFIILFFAGILALPFVLPKAILDRFTSIGDMKDSSTSYRVNIWKACIDMIEGCKLASLGQGKDVFNRIYPMFAYNESMAEHSHNLYLQIIIETGICGILTFVFMIYRFYQYIFNGIKNTMNFSNKVYLIGFVSAMSGFLIQSIFDNSWYNYRVVLIFWAFIGLAVSYRKYMVNEVDTSND
ncbi:MAG: hypothetical protein E7311_05055 [Clostridiales bacterium]|nr:hypothetical protein [Clostridiales bacterium]